MDGDRGIYEINSCLQFSRIYYKKIKGSWM